MNRTRTPLIVFALMIAILALSAVPALAAPSPPAAAQPGLHTAHCATMGTPGHMHAPYVCPMSHEECVSMPAM